MATYSLQSFHNHHYHSPIFRFEIVGDVFQPIGREGMEVAPIGSEEESGAKEGERICMGEG